MNKTDFREVPRSALRFTAECEFGSNGEGAKTAPFKMIARTGDPINHVWWGKVVHDLSSISTTRPRLNIDYEHQDIIGYCNKFDTTTGDLVASGVIQSVRPGDKAEEVIVRGQSGQPYEASIAFDNDLDVEEVPEGKMALVNGRNVEGPACVIRNWTLRSIAVCKSGADKYTTTQFNDNSDTVKVRFTRSQMDKQKPEAESEELVETPEVEADQEQPTETPACPCEVEAAISVTVQVDAVATVETEDEEEDEEAEAQAVEIVKPEAQPVAEPEPEMVSEHTGQDFVYRFGQQGAVWFAEGKTYQSCLSLAYDQVQMEYSKLLKENETLKTRLAAIGAAGEKKPVAVSPSDEQQTGIDAGAYARMTKRGVTPAVAAFAAGLKLPTRKVI